jgi:hypothetical protein
MSHEEITFNDGFHQTSFIDSLQYITNDVTPSLAMSPANVEFALSQDANGADGAALRQIFQGFLSSHYFNYNNLGKLTSTNWQDFETNWKNWVVKYAGIYNFDFNANVPTTIGTTNLFYLFKNVFRESIADNWANDPAHFSDGSVNPDSDWAIFATPPDPINLNYNALNSTNPAFTSLSHFLDTFQPFSDEIYTPPSTGTASDDFLVLFTNQLSSFYTTTATIQDPGAFVASDPVYEALPTYEGIYSAFGPAHFDRTRFIADIKQFYNEQIAKNGYFLPSQSFGEWVTAVRLNYLATSDLISSSSLAGNSSEKALILDRILLLLIKLIQSLQNVGIAQANRLRYITQYQQAYTALQTQIPVFTRQLNSPIGGSTQEESNTRNTLNTAVNGLLADNLRALRGLQEDSGKKMQSNVNQTNDAVNQQTDMATTFIQQMSSLLTVILR